MKQFEELDVIDDFVKLPNLYIITITNYDPFGYGYMMYTIYNMYKDGI